MTEPTRRQDGPGPAARARRRPHAAAASRLLATGMSAAAVLGLTAGWMATEAPAATPPEATVRVVVTDSRISPELAARAAVTAAAAGRTRTAVTVAAATDHASSPGPPAADVTTRAS